MLLPPKIWLIAIWLVIFPAPPQLLCGAYAEATWSVHRAYANSLQPRLPVGRFNRKSAIHSVQPFGGLFVEPSPMSGKKRTDMTDVYRPLVSTRKSTHTALRTSCVKPPNHCLKVQNIILLVLSRRVSNSFLCNGKGWEWDSRPILFPRGNVFPREAWKFDRWFRAVPP